MAVQPSDALQQKIHRAKLGDQNVQIKVQRLLHHLRAHHDQIVPALRHRILADAFHQLLFPRGAVRHQELCMEQLHLFVGQALPQQLRDLLRFFNCVDDHSRTAALRQLPAQQPGQLCLRERGQLHRLSGCVQRDDGLLYLCAVRPCQKRIAAAKSPRGVRVRPALLLIRFDQLCTPPGRQGGRQQDHRHLVPAQPFQCAIQIAVHVSIVGMALVDDHHLARKPQMPQHHVLLGQCCHQQLIHCADDEAGQQCLLAAPEPLMHLYLMLFRRILFQLHPAPLQPKIVLIQLCHSMGQLDGLRHLLRLGICPVEQPTKDAVCRSLRGQSEKDATQTEPAGHDLRSGQSRLCFAHAHLRFQNQDARFCRSIHRIQNHSLHGVGRKAEPHLKLLRFCNALLRLPWEGERQLFPRPVHPRRIILPAAQLFHWDQREILRVAGDPVCHDQKSRQQNLFGLVEHRQRICPGIAAVLQCRLKQFVPKALPYALLLFRVIVALPAVQLLIDCSAVLGSAMVCPHNGSKPAGTPLPQQDCLPCPGMR